MTDTSQHINSSNVSDGDGSRFCQATAVMFYIEDEELLKYSAATIDQGINQVKFPEGYSQIGKSIWVFDNPEKPDEQYAGIFPGVKDITNDPFQKMVNGQLFTNGEPTPDKSVVMIIVGANGSCGAAFGMVRHTN